MKKKLLTTMLLALSCGCAIAGFACNKGDGSLAGTDFSVSFVDGAGYSFDGEGYQAFLQDDDKKLAYGHTLSFEVEVGAFYTGTPIVYCNETPLQPILGVYTATVSGDTVIRVEGVRKDVSNMQGSGSYEDAFVVTKPIDLLYIAEQVNKGVSQYVNGSYILANDIDCKGEELQVIGNHQTDKAYFAGCFSASSGESESITQHTISNFVINTSDVNYVGLFGHVYCDPSVTGSGLFYGIRLENFEINVDIQGSQDGNATLVVGSLIGYAQGANAYVCDAINGEINVYADIMYFSYAGGLIGYQQSMYTGANNQISEVAYCSTDVDVNILSGMVLYAGGITGYLETNYIYTNTVVHHSYALGDVSGALRAGGVVGGLGQYTSVSSVYSTGNVYAQSEQSSSDAYQTEESENYYYSYAGGIVGYAENDSIVNDCFFTGETDAYAESGDSYALTGVAVAGGAQDGSIYVNTKKYVVDNCLPNGTITNLDFADTSWLTDTLGWRGVDWVITAGERPTINLEPSYTGSITLTVRYMKQDGNGSMTPVACNGRTSVTMNYINFAAEDASYAPIGNAFLSGSLSPYYTADNGYLSYGFFFDAECTKPVPYSYLSSKNVVIYVAFADPTPVVGEYKFAVKGTDTVVTLTLDNDGIATYTDGETENTTPYSFDGETIFFENARFARYYLGDVVLEEDTENDGTAETDPNFDMYRYMYYPYYGTVNADGVMSLYDGVYFMQDAPLKAYLATNALQGAYYIKESNAFKTFAFHGDTVTVTTDTGTVSVYTYSVIGDKAIINNQEYLVSDFTAHDIFKGKWDKKATVHKSYEFDGMGEKTGNFVCTVNGVETKGTYTLNDNRAVLSNGEIAYFDSLGYLIIEDGAKQQLLYTGNSYTGVWKNSSNGSTVTLWLNGLNQEGAGSGRIEFTQAGIAGGYYFEITYGNAEKDGYVCMYFNGELVGYCSYVPTNNTLSAYIYNPYLSGSYANISLSLTDSYEGEWISDSPVFENVEFDGAGFINGAGKIYINGAETPVTYTLGNYTLNGTFIYGGVRYELSYDEDNELVYIKNGEIVSELQRKDRFADIVLIDEKGTTYAFDGKSKLDKAGKLTQTTADGVITEFFYDWISENAYAILKDNQKLATLTQSENAYYVEWTNGDDTTQLLIQNEYMGKWAISGGFGVFEIGATDINGKISAVYDGYDVELIKTDSGYKFTYTDITNMPYTYYVMKNEGYLFLSEYEDFLSYSYCVKCYEPLLGKWVWNESPDTVLEFDGIVENWPDWLGTARFTVSGENADSYTYYYYTMIDDVVLMRSVDQLNGERAYYRLEWTTDVHNPNAFVYDDGNTVRAFIRVQVDSLYGNKAHGVTNDDKNTVYVFNGGNVGNKLGEIQVNGEKVYDYKIVNVLTNDSAELELTDLSGKKYTAILDYKDLSNILLKSIMPLEEV